MTSFSERKPPTGDRLRQQQETETAEPASAPEESAPLTGASHLPGNGNTRLLQQSLGNAAITRLLSGRTERGRTDPASSQGTAPYPDGGTTMNPRAGLPTSSGSGSASLNSSKGASALLGPIGNRALATVLQRQDAAVDEAVRTDVAGEAAPLLDAAQIADARSYYTSQPWRYTPAIIAQLRGSLGLDAEGGVDAALVLAVAQFQVTDGAGDPALVVDGKAGPRTLPRIFRGGLNVEATGQELGEEVQDEVIDEWASLSTAEARRDRLIELVNERLVAAGVPAVTAAFDANVNNAGSFSFSTWRMEIGRSRLAADTISEEDARDTADTVYHEARHTEQWFRMAQLRAGQGLSAAAITTELFIPARIATAAKGGAAGSWLDGGSDRPGWWDSVYGSGSAHREAVLAEIDRAATARRLAADLHAANPTAATQAALDRADARFQRAFAAYQNLPEENDAWATGPLAAAGISGGSPEPEPESEAGGPPGEAGEPAGSPPSDEGPAHGDAAGRESTGWSCAVTATVEAIFALCASVSEATSAEEEALRGASTSPAFAVIEIVRIPGEVSLDHVAVQLAEPVRLPELEAAFGPGRKLPTRPDGDSMRTVIFDDTVPAEGSTGATLLADVQGSDLVVRLVVRRDVL